MVKLPEHYVLNYFYDNDGGCALTTLVNHERHHIIVDPKELKDRSKAGKKLRREYQRLLQQVQAEAAGEEATRTAPLFVQKDEDEDGESEGKDSGIDVSSRSGGSSASEDEDEHDAGPPEALQKWMLKPLASTFTSKSSKKKDAKQRTVQDWYHCKTHFYHLTIASGKLSAVEDNAPKTLTDRIDRLIPTINLPKYIQKLDVPSFAASDIKVLDEAEGPAEVPVHPTLVEYEGNQYFLKAVDNAQPGPTKREIQVMTKIESEGLHNEMRVPLLRGLVHFDDDSSKSKMMGFLMDAIDEPTPLTKMLSTDVAEDKRNKWAQESARMVDLLHQHGIIWGDSKGDNFMVDKNEDLWIIDFGGSYTEGWVDPELKDSEEGDDQGIRRLVNGLKDPENNTVGDEDEECDNEREEVARMQHEADHPESLKRKHQRSQEEEQEEADERAARQRKTSGEKRTDDSHVPFEEGKTVESEAVGDGDADEQQQEEFEDIEMQDREEEEHAGEEETKASSYCYCGGPDSGRMLACDGEQCKKEWFHFECLGLKDAPEAKKWYCDDCLMVEEWKSMHFASKLHCGG